MAGSESTTDPGAGTGSPGALVGWTGNLSSAPGDLHTGTPVDSTTSSSPATTYIQDISSDRTQTWWSTVTLRQSAVASTARGEYFTGSTALLTAHAATGDTLLSSVSSSVSSSPYDSVETFRSTVMDSTSFVGTVWLNDSNSAADVVASDAPAEDTLARDVVVGVLLSSLGLMTVFGNTLVIVAIYRERCLRTVTNFFIASLASADFVIGTTVIPFAIYNELRFGRWVFGKAWCDVWHAVDILACTASITNLCVIAVDRYWAITRPMSYPSKMTKKLGTLLIAFVWICSALISFPCIAWWHAVEPPDRPETDCVFPEDPTYLIISSCISFYIPSALMIFMYAQVYRTAVEQVKVMRSGQRKVHAGPQQGAMSMRVHRGGAMNNNHHHHHHTNGYTARSAGVTGGLHGGAKSAASTARKSLLAGMNREHKAARTLGIVMGVFIMCWLPFFICNVMAPVCPDCVVNPHVTFPVVTWLGYANSALNPAIYAFTSRKYKRAFIKIICDCLPRRYQPVKWDRRRRPRRTMSMSNAEPDSSYTMVEYGDIPVRSPDRKIDSSTAILSGSRPHLYSLRQTYF